MTHWTSVVVGEGTQSVWLSVIENQHMDLLEPLRVFCGNASLLLPGASAGASTVTFVALGSAVGGGVSGVVAPRHARPEPASAAT